MKLRGGWHVIPRRFHRCSSDFRQTSASTDDFVSCVKIPAMRGKIRARRGDLSLVQHTGFEEPAQSLMHPCDHVGRVDDSIHWSRIGAQWGAEQLVVGIFNER